MPEWCNVTEGNRIVTRIVPEFTIVNDFYGLAWYNKFENQPPRVGMISYYEEIEI